MFIKELFKDLLSRLSGEFGVYLRKQYFLPRITTNAKLIKIKQDVELIGLKNIYLGDNFSIDRCGRLYSDDKSSIKIGDNVSLNKNVLINARGGGKITIGDNCLIASNVVIRSNNRRPYENFNGA